MRTRSPAHLLWVVSAGCAGALLGVGGATFDYAEGTSYFSTDPAACANCHIMQSWYDSWQKSSHHTSATCIDCHLPHGFLPKYAAKARNGWNHSKAFTLQNFIEPIRISRSNAAVLQANCLHCHEDLVHDTALSVTPRERADHDRPALRCVHCHVTVGHGDRVGLGGARPATEEGLVR